ncbi:phosphoribosyltransferase family protein [Mycobacteroides abscessus]|uniref:phosphoribosyltransferase family protein n=1 Tax=Mycobacteroides abscessus TaxID=36809 RepID=UPI00078EB2E2|nr:phosphoribosyltransferase family protein [Mycobacteroides abscessus]AMU77873.1 hypothetical protein A3O06_04565 [Mycobacteroides abscessus]ANO26832.1 hypothetical protein BAB79_04565 [Mycobacteroides abscessus]
MTISFKAYVQGRGTFSNVAEPFRFPGGEWHLRYMRQFAESDITWIADVRGADANDLVKAGLLAQHVSYLDQPHNFVLMLPYFPAARADRGTPLGAATYAKLINSMYADQVISVDLHSRAAWDWTNDLTEVPVTALFIDRALMGREYDSVIAPDRGALSRAQQVATHLGIEVVRVEKYRDFATGRITGMELIGNVPKPGRFLVVDDICDGGGTFIALAELLNLPKDQLDLWVTHGIFSGKAGQLHDHYGRIYTTDSHPGAYSGAVRPFSIVPTFPIMFNAMRNGLSK